MTNKVNIAYCFDENYQQHAAASMMSVLSNFGAKPEQLAFHILTDSLTQKMAAYGEDLTRLFGCSVSFYDVGEHAKVINDQIPANLFHGKIWTIATLFRLLIPSILPISVNKVLYLDSDTIAVDDVAKLFETDIGSNPSAAVIDSMQIEARRKRDVQKYFNAGVIMMQLDYWREHGISKKCIDYLCTPGADVAFTDQDAINNVLVDQIYEYPSRWNRLVSNGLVSDSDSENALQKTSIFHFVNVAKPWHAWYINQLGQQYWSYLRASPWKEPTLQKPKLVKELHMMARATAKEGKLVEATAHYEALVQHFLKR